VGDGDHPLGDQCRPSYVDRLWRRTAGTFPRQSARHAVQRPRRNAGLDDDFFRVVVEQRKRLADGNPLGEFLKVLANSGSYGIDRKRTGLRSFPSGASMGSSPLNQEHRKSQGDFVFHQ